MRIKRIRNGPSHMKIWNNLILIQLVVTALEVGSVKG